jgi:CO dehydrogenase maturation factor
MRIAFVGKGGSGKTTVSSLFTLYTKQFSNKNVWAIDADLNMHLAEQLGLKEEVSNLKHISAPDSEKDIKSYLIGENENIKGASHFKKSTPPTEKSKFIIVADERNYILKNYSVQKDKLFLSIVGSYHSDGIGASCYHNNLAVLESMLSHTIDVNGSVIVDMVAGIDAFAGTLHAQFDMTVLVVEPTKKSLEVYEQYKQLSQEAGVWDDVYVVGNKISSDKDKSFIRDNIEEKKLIGFLNISEHIKDVEQGDAELDINLLEEENKKVFEEIFNGLSSINISYNARLNKLYSLHKKYVAQSHIKDRLGDLTDQIDLNFDFDELVKKYE